MIATATALVLFLALLYPCWRFTDWFVDFGSRKSSDAVETLFFIIGDIIAYGFVLGLTVAANAAVSIATGIFVGYYYFG